MKIDRGEVYTKYKGRCAYCGEDIRIKDMQVDHIRAKQIFNFGHIKDIPDYDVDDIRNLNPSCRVCNNFKDVWSVEQFRENLEDQVEKARKYSGQFRRAEKYGLIEIKKKKVIFYFEKDSPNE